MIYYQPSQSLTWRYYSSTGNLSVMSRIFLDLATNEKVTYSVLGPTAGKVIITLNVGSSGEFSPLTIEIPVTTIEPGLNVNQVRDRIKIIPAFEVRATIYKNNVQEGEVINSTSAGSAIEIL